MKSKPWTVAYKPAVLPKSLGLNKSRNRNCERPWVEYANITSYVTLLIVSFIFPEYPTSLKDQFLKKKKKELKNPKLSK